MRLRISLSPRRYWTTLTIYRVVLESYSARPLPHGQWEPIERFNLRVLNGTGDFCRYRGATPHAEFLYECVQRAIEMDWPVEAGFLRRYDALRQDIEELFDMPERTLHLLFRFLQQNGGRLSQRARKRGPQLSDDEAARVEDIYHFQRSDRLCRGRRNRRKSKLRR